MLKIDTAIINTSRVICKNISRFDASERGLLSQNILAQLRNLVEYTAGKVYANGADTNPNDYNAKTNALKYLSARGDLRFLNRFHDLLQKSASHYTLDEDSSERLMLKYYEYLLKIKTYLWTEYQLQVLENIEDFPLNTDTELERYYEKIAERIQYPDSALDYSPYRDRCYIEKIKPFFVNQRVYYEVTYTAARNHVSKFDRVIAFTALDILEHYAVKLSAHSDKIQIFGKEMNIQVIDSWEVSIRPCELDNFADIFGAHTKISGDTNEYVELMRFLTETGMSLTELVESSEEYYQFVRKKISVKSRALHFFAVLDQCRRLVTGNLPGCNVIRYLLLDLHNKNIKAQFSKEECQRLSNLHLHYGCIPFDEMPYDTSLINHNPRLYDLFECISPVGREHELFARMIRNNTETRGMLFTRRSDIKSFDNIEDLILQYNSRLYHKHTHRRIELFHNYIYIKGYAEDSGFIIRQLKALAVTGVMHYTSSVDFWLQQLAAPIDCPEKVKALRQMFAASRVALIYGSAGTGKSTLISHVSNLFGDKEKLYLENTNPAVDNMRRKVKTGKSTFKTVASFLSDKNMAVSCDLLFIDECSTLSNKDMRDVLRKAKFKLLVLVGDVFQIESIRFGNWFSIARSFVPQTSVFELTHPYRSTDPALLTVWDRVRNLDMAILEPMVKNGYSARLDESIFDKSEADQIILCLNYDGLYGINNINRFLQSANPNPYTYWGVNLYKIGDPILFNESNRFAPLIYNNMKGRIVDIAETESSIWFDIELDVSFNSLDVEGYDLELAGQSDFGHSIIRFSVDKAQNTDEDDDQWNCVIPFQVAYAVSIHRAQGLEYQSVKIVITNEVEE